MRHVTIKLLEVTIGKTFPNINHTKVFTGQSPKATEIKISKCTLINLTSFSTTKETINKMKRQQTRRKYLQTM